MKKSKKYHLYGSEPFTQSEIDKGFKVCYSASDMEKLDDVMRAKHSHMNTRQNHMKKMMEY